MNALPIECICYLLTVILVEMIYVSVERGNAEAEREHSQYNTGGEKSPRRIEEGHPHCVRQRHNVLDKHQGHA